MISSEMLGCSTAEPGSTALAFLDSQLAQSGADLAYLSLFFEERAALAMVVATNAHDSEGSE